MNKTLVKFTNYLDNSANELKRNIQMRVNQVGEDNLDALDKLTIDKYNERVNMSRMLKVPRESWEMYGELFIDFKILSELMIAGGLKGKEIFTVVFHLLEKNLGAHVLDASVRFFDIKKIAKYNFSGYKHLNQKVIVEMVRSEEYGLVTLNPENLDHIIVGDTIRYRLLDESESGGKYNAELENLTQNDLSASKQSYIKILPYSYEVIPYKKKTDKSTFRTDRLELEYDYNDWHFVLGLINDEIPMNIYKELLEKYDVEFFEKNILMYCGLKSTGVEVTAATQPMEKDMYYSNVISVKELTQEQIPEDEEYILVVSIPKDEWNGKTFDLYLYE